MQAHWCSVGVILWSIEFYIFMQFFLDTACPFDGTKNLSFYGGTQITLN